MNRREFLKYTTIIGLGSSLPIHPQNVSAESGKPAITTFKDTPGYYTFNSKTPDLGIYTEQLLIDLTAQDYAKYLISGWNYDREGFTWVVGNTAEFYFYTFSPDVDKRVWFVCRSFEKLQDQSLQIYLNDAFLQEIPVASQKKIHEVYFPAKLQKRYKNLVRLVFRQTGSPKDFGMNLDIRKLAACFYRIELRARGEPQKITRKIPEVTGDKQKNLLIPLNTIVEKEILVKPDSSLELFLSSPENGISGTFRVLAKYGGKTEQLIAFPLQTLPILKKVSIAKYSNCITQFSFVYEGEKPQSSETTRVVSFRGKLTRPVNAKNTMGLNILFISIDTLRADHLGCYGGNVKTPNIDNLAHEGVLFKQAYCHIPITLPSHTSMFTGMYPHDSGVFNNFGYIHDHLRLLPEIFSLGGFKTYGFTSLGTLERETMFNQGFQYYADTSGKDGWFSTAGEVNDLFYKMADRFRKGENRFLFLHYSDPHDPYHAHGTRVNNVVMRFNNTKIGQINVSDENHFTVNLSLQPGTNRIAFTGDNGFWLKTVDLRTGSARWKPGEGLHEKQDGFFFSDENCELLIVNPGPSAVSAELFLFFDDDVSDLEHIRKNYRLEVEYLDKKLGELCGYMQSKGLLDNTVLILTSDHGEGLGDHGEVGHVHQLYNSMIHVPLIVSGPGLFQGGRKIEPRVRHIDLWPTLLDLFHIKTGTESAGETMLPILKSTDTRNRQVFSMTFAPEAKNNLVSLMDSYYKIIRNLDLNTYELYDIVNDPSEQLELSKKNPVKLVQMRKKLENILEKENFVKKFRGLNSIPLSLNEETKKKLKALGYTR